MRVGVEDTRAYLATKLPEEVVAITNNGYACLIARTVMHAFQAESALVAGSNTEACFRKHYNASWISVEVDLELTHIANAFDKLGPMSDFFKHAPIPVKRSLVEKLFPVLEVSNEL